MNLKSSALTASLTASIPLVLLIAPFFLWGTAMVALKDTLTHTTPLFLASLRVLPAGGLLLGVAALLGRSQPRTWQAWSWILLFALVDGTLFQGFLAEGLVHTGAGLGSVLIDSQPLVVAILALILFQERLGGWGWGGLVLGIGGISLLGFPLAWVPEAGGLRIALDGQLVELGFLSNFLMHSLNALGANGEVLMLMAAISMAIGTILSRYVSRYVDPIVATGWHLILGGIPLILGSWQWETDQMAQLGWMDWGNLAYATVFGTAIAYGLFFYFAARGSLTSLSALTFLTPVFALLFSNWLLGEVLTPIQLTGVCCVLGSIYLINQREVLPTYWQKIWSFASDQWSALFAVLP